MTHVFRSLKAIAKNLTVLLIGVAMLFSLSQTPVLAADARTGTRATVAPDRAEPTLDETNREKKAERREWQSQASSLRDENTQPSSLGETLKEKLNLDEITEGYDPDREAAKRSIPNS